MATTAAEKLEEASPEQPEQVAAVAEEPPVIADNVRKKLAPEHIQVERIGSWIFAGVVILLMLVPQVLGLVFDWYSGMVATWILLGSLAVSGFLLWIAYWWPRKEYQYHAYRVNESGMDIWSGIIWRKVTMRARATWSP
ncbi:MAG: hypothetical protein ACYTG5_07130 [Planctomycetota bacterium]